MNFKSRSFDIGRGGGDEAFIIESTFVVLVMAAVVFIWKTYSGCFIGFFEL